jgi:glycosyltransferase involved in cell wall biosynthesis
MKMLLVCNMVSPHQLPLARELAVRVGAKNFLFAATGDISADRAALGWEARGLEPWVVQSNKASGGGELVRDWLNVADVVLTGDRTLPGAALRNASHRLTFYMSERWWKPPLGVARVLHPRFALMAIRFGWLAQSPWLHFLPIGGYAARDIRRIAKFPQRMWAWGYFPSLPESIPETLERPREFRILWAGRMLHCKRVDSLLQAFALLLRIARQARLVLIGDGPSRESLVRLAESLGIANEVQFMASMPAAKVREQMRGSHVYVLPSNGYEGWGAVLNEAMSEGCAVVASEAAGAAKAMITHGENGLLFRTGDCRQLGTLLAGLYSDEPLRRRLAQAGQRAILECWSPRVAAERFLSVCDALLSKRPVPSFSNGPMAPAWED